VGHARQQGGLAEDLERIGAENARLEADLARAETVISELREERDRERRERAALQQTSAASSSSAAAPSPDPALVAEAARLSADVARLTSELAAEKTRAKEAAEQGARYRDQREKLKSELDITANLMADMQLQAQTAAGKIAALEKELKEARVQVADLQAAPPAAPAPAPAAPEAGPSEDLSALLEDITVAKELAEAKVEVLEMENADLKVKVELLEMDKEIYLAEKATTEPAAASAVAPSAEPADVAALRAQNEQLVATLAKLRDVAQDTQRRAKEEVAAAKRETDAARYEVSEMKQTLDESSGLSTMVERLTEKNLALAEEIRARDVTISELEEMKALADEVEAISADTIEQYKSQLSREASRAADLEAEASRLRVALSDGEVTISRFREAVKGLQRQLADAQKKEGSAAEKQENLSLQTHAVLSENLALQSKASAVEALRAELALARAASSGAAAEAALLRSLLPAHLFESELSAVDARASVTRALAKLAALQELLVQGPLQSDAAGGVDAAVQRLLRADASPSDDQVLALDLLMALPAVAHQLHAAQAALESQDEEAFRKVVGLRRHFAASESLMDRVAAALRDRSLSKSHATEAAGEATRLQPLLDGIPGGVKLPAWRLLEHGVASVGDLFVSLHTHVRRLQGAFLALRGSSEHPAGDKAFAALLADCGTVYTETRSLASKLRGRAIRVSPIVRKRLAACQEAHAAAAAALTAQADKLASVSMASPLRDPSLDAVAAALTDKAEGAVSGLVARVLEVVQELGNLAASGAIDDPSAAPAPAEEAKSAWDVMAVKRTAALGEVGGLREKLEEATEKLKVKTRSSQVLETQVRDMTIKCETLEKKIAELRAKGDGIDGLQKQVDRLLSEAAEFDEQLREKEREILALERDNKDLKDKVKRAGATPTLSGHAALSVPGPVTGGPGAAADALAAPGTLPRKTSRAALLNLPAAAADLAEELAVARRALRAALDERSQLLAERARWVLSDLSPIAVDVRPAKQTPEAERLAEQLFRVTTVLQQTRLASASATVPRLDAPAVARDSAKGQLKDLQQRCREVEAEAKRALLALPGQSSPGSFAQSLKGEAKDDPSKGSLRAKIYPTGQQGPAVKVALSGPELKKLHTIFA
jgi:hypothetical protein